MYIYVLCVSGGSDSHPGVGVEFAPVYGWLSSGQSTENVQGNLAKVFHTKGGFLLTPFSNM